jgi:hypothetical protein
MRECSKIAQKVASFQPFFPFPLPNWAYLRGVNRSSIGERRARTNPELG